MSVVEVRETQYDNPKILHILFVNKKLRLKYIAVGRLAVALRSHNISISSKSVYYFWAWHELTQKQHLQWHVFRNINSLGTRVIFSTPFSLTRNRIMEILWVNFLPVCTFAGFAIKGSDINFGIEWTEAVSMPCRTAKGLDCVFPMINTVRLCLIHTCHAVPGPYHNHAVLKANSQGHGTARHGHGIICMN
jgi:hypothetical protein